MFILRNLKLFWVQFGLWFLFGIMLLRCLPEVVIFDVWRYDFIWMLQRIQWFLMMLSWKKAPRWSSTYDFQKMTCKFLKALRRNPGTDTRFSLFYRFLASRPSVTVKTKSQEPRNPLKDLKVKRILFLGRFVFLAGGPHNNNQSTKR